MKKKLLKNIKENDVFHFRPNDWSEFANWCRENTFIARKDDKGKIYFFDTYWGYSERSDNKRYSFSEANKLGRIEFSFNLDEVKEIEDYDRDYYNDEDIYRLTNQHACVPSCINYFVKKETLRSQKKMIEVLEEKIRKARHTIERETSRIQEYSAKKQQVEDGKLDIYI